MWSGQINVPAFVWHSGYNRLKWSLLSQFASVVLRAFVASTTKTFHIFLPIGPEESTTNLVNGFSESEVSTNCSCMTKAECFVNFNSRKQQPKFSSFSSLCWLSLQIHKFVHNGKSVPLRCEFLGKFGLSLKFGVTWWFVRAESEPYDRSEFGI